MGVRSIPSILFLVFGGLVACTTFNGLTAEDGLDVPNPSGKNANSACSVDKDCKSLSCKSGKCSAVAGANPTNTTKDGDESDIDCGGSSAPACEDGKACSANEDCLSVSCITKVCKAPAPDDGVKNADESDVDCGGAAAPKCASGKTCAADADCSVGGCNYKKVCVDSPSCVGHEGGDTCGEDGKQNCCLTAKDGNTSIGKYYVTAGRMRAFVTKFNGDLKKWASTAKGWDPSWTDELPESMDDVLQTLGPGNKRGCSVSAQGQGARTYWQPPIPDFQPDEKQDFEQKVLDEKILNCVPWVMAQAICHFDGGRITTSAELEALITNHGTTKYPWGDSPPFPPSKDSPGIEEMNHNFSYATPNPPAALRGGTDSPTDHAYFIPPPGRASKGKNNIGVEDAAGSMLAWTGDRANTFAWTGSWENHGMMGIKVDNVPYPTGPVDWPGQSADANEVRDGYYGIGVRCAFDK